MAASIAPERIFLTGFMGSGKSTIAPILARLLGFRCVDLDARIEAASGMSVSEIFSAGGEAEFREREKAALLETFGMDGVVVSLGGGTLTFGGNDALVKSAGLLVYLRVDFEILFSRVRGKEDRPLLAGAPGTIPLKQSMERLFSEREPFYRRADVVIDAGDRDPAAVAGLIAAAVTDNPGG